MVESKDRVVVLQAFDSTLVDIGGQEDVTEECLMEASLFFDVYKENNVIMNVSRSNTAWQLIN
jgi:hypothetical protein